MSRANLFTGTSGGLRAVASDEKDFITFSAKGMDPFEDPPERRPLVLGRVLEGCNSCHHVAHERAIETVLSLRRMLKPWPLVDSRHEHGPAGSHSRYLRPTRKAARANGDLSRDYGKRNLGEVIPRCEGSTANVANAQTRWLDWV